MISGIFVSYRSGEAACSAIETFRDSARAAGLVAEAVAVVNSGDAAEAARLRDVADRTLVPERNLGFAGGLNRGIREARGQILALANPDLVFAESSIGPLVEEARSAPAACGPAFFLDQGETLLLPPAEEPRPAALLRRSMEADPAKARRLFQRELSRVRRLAAAVAAGRTLEASGLSGALLVVSRATLERAGPFDEGYPLYYEENDWQRRLRLLGGRLQQVTAARVVHRYNQSARAEPRAAGWFAASERRYFVSHFSEKGSRALERLAAAPAAEPSLAALEGGVLRIRAAPSVAVALSPRAVLWPFAYAVLPGGSTSWRVPADVASGMSGTWFARAFVPETGEVLVEGSLSAPSASP